MRIRALAQLLYDSEATAEGGVRRERIEAFLRALARARRWKLLPRLLAALERLEAEAGAPPLELRLPDRSLPAPEGAAVVEDAAMIAGAAVRSGDTLVDTSLRTQLTRLTQVLKS